VAAACKVEKLWLIVRVFCLCRWFPHSNAQPVCCIYWSSVITLWWCRPFYGAVGWQFGQCSDIHRHYSTALLIYSHIFTSAKADVMQSGEFVCHSVCRIAAKKVISWFHWNLMLWLGLPSRRTDWLLLVILPWIQIPHRCSTCHHW